MRARAIIALIVVAIGALSGCASSGRAAGSVEPPIMLSRLRPDLRLYGSDVSGAGSGRASTVVKIEVIIDAAGLPAMSTLKLVGTTSTENRDAIADWIAASTFRPAQNVGQPVTGIYKTSLTIRAARRL